MLRRFYLFYALIFRNMSIAFHLYMFYMHGNIRYTQQHFAPGEWRDTIPAIPGRILVRYHVDTFVGKVIFHCKSIVSARSITPIVHI